jgi:hypothetical protein
MRIISIILLGSVILITTQIVLPLFGQVTSRPANDKVNAANSDVEVIIAQILSCPA